MRLAWLLLAMAGAGPAAAAQPAGFAWPHGEQAAVSLAYDDALDSQLDHAVPALDRYGLKASFYLTLSSPTLSRRLPEWRALAARGFELGNHTLFHQCQHSLPGREWVSPERDLDHTSAAQMLEQVRLGNAMLQAIDGASERTFTLPCGDRLAAGVDYLPLLHGEFIAIKAGEGGVVADMQSLDPFAVGVTAPSDVTGAQLIDLVKQAQARGTMINFTFHGIGGDYLSVSTQAHAELLAYLAAHRQQVWTDTFAKLMTHVKAQQALAEDAATDTLALPDGYRLAWADEFEAPGLPDPSNWAYDTERNRAGWYNHELQYYAAARVQNSVVRDGRLVITARREALSAAADWGGQRYSSARLVTRGKHEWTYGFASVRARLPCGSGTWPAIWTLGSHGDWPARGELDMMEQLGTQPGRILSTVHTTAASGAKGKGGQTRLADACGSFHDYQMLWTPEQVRFGVDGRQHFAYRNTHTGVSQWPFDAPQFLILNLAVGGDLGGPVDETVLPATLEVEYVRVWQAPDAPRP